MNMKQQLATGVLALVIVGSIAFMPVDRMFRSSTRCGSGDSETAAIAVGYTQMRAATSCTTRNRKRRRQDWALFKKC